MTIGAGWDGPVRGDGGRILLAEDDPHVAALVADALGDEGYRVTVRRDGTGAGAAALIEPPDLMLLDVMLPGLDGGAVCRRLKAHPSTRDVPVVFLTAADEEVLEEQLLGCRYEALLHKPFALAELLAAVQRHLRGAPQAAGRDLFLSDCGLGPSLVP